MQSVAVISPKPRQRGAAEDYCDERLALGHVTLVLSELVAKSGLSAIAAERQLARLRGRVTRVSPRQPFYLIVSPEHRGNGAPPPSWWLHEYFAWLKRPYYLALQSAASIYGSNPQALQVTQVMTDRPLRPIRVGKLQVVFFVKQKIGQTPTESPRGAVAPLFTSTPEATAFDLIRYASSIGGIDRAADTIRPMMDRLNDRKLAEVLRTEKLPTTAQRLGFVLDALGARSLLGTIRDWLPAELKPVSLAPERGDSGKETLSKRWQVYNNSHELKV